MEDQGSGQSVLSKLSSLIYGGKDESVEARQYWMPDDISLECYQCTSKFTSIRRRHHCRVCGQVFCSKCCSFYIPGQCTAVSINETQKQFFFVSGKNSGTIRVCTVCFSSYESSVENDPQSVAGAGGGAGRGQETGEEGVSCSPVQFRRRLSIDQVVTSSPGSAVAGHRKLSSTVPLYTREETETPVTSGHTPGEQEPVIKLRDPQHLSRLWSRVMDSDQGLTLETHRYYLRSYPGTFQGRHLVQWLVSQDQASLTSHNQAVAIGQALLSGGMMSSVSGSDQFSGGTELYLPVTDNVINNSDHIKDEPDTDAAGATSAVHEPDWLQDLPEFSVSNNKTVIKESEKSGGQSAQDEHDSDQIIEVVDMGELQQENIVMDPEDSESSAVLENVYHQHEQCYLTKMFQHENIPDDWRETVNKLAETAVMKVTPDVRGNDDEMDILAHVKVKCVAGGQRSDSRLVEGEVCSLQLTHKTMKQVLVRPRIALLAESIMFKDRQTMVSLETVALQEAEYVKNVTGKLLDLKPDLILVEKSVAHIGQEILRRAGVSLAVNVKPRVLSRLSRRTQASIIKSVDSMMSAPRLGSCAQVSSQLAGVNQRLLLFEGCNPALGGTILLRGGDKRFLAKVKAVLKRLILIKYNWKHERSLLANEYGSVKDNSIKDIDFDKHQLAISPFIKVDKSVEVVPLAVEVTDNCDVEDDCDELIEHNNNEKHSWCDQFISHKISSLTDRSFLDQQALFRASGWRRHHNSVKQVKTVEKSSPVTLPRDMTQVLSVQFSMFSKQSRVAPNYCVSPFLVNMQLYATRDMALGEFLEELCFAPDYECPNKQCSTPPILHTRRFCHAGGAVTLHMQQLEAPIMSSPEQEEHKLMMWKYCTHCELITNIVPVSDLTWSLSFAMFLQLLLHETRLVKRGSGRPDAVCSHSLHQQHLTCFGKADLVVTFRYSQLHVWEIQTPSETLSIPGSSSSRAQLTTKLLECKEASSTHFSSVLTKLHSFTNNSGLETDHDQEHKSFRDRLEKLEEAVNDNTEAEKTLSLLQLFQRDVMMSHCSWLKRLSLLQENMKTTKKSESVRLVENNDHDNTTAVKKIISTILPHSEDIQSSLAAPFPGDIHLITHVNGVDVDFPSTVFVHESKPSTLIAYLLSSKAYQQYLTTPEQDVQHFVLEMSDATTKFYCCSYFTQEFHQLRKLISTGQRDESKFIKSLSDCSRWEAMGGKSGLMFYKTSDDRFVLKQMSKFEYGSFLEFAPHYFNYMKESLETGTKTLLGKIVGVYKVGFKNSESGAGLNMEFLIMENLFFGKNVNKSYDLKGSVRNRLITEADTEGQGIVLLDENLLRVSCESPLYLNQQDKDVLNQAINRDSSFLASHCMMDYSLLAGVCEAESRLVVGIIDYIRTFTWDKKLETLVKSVKSSGVFGGQAKTPTVINPDLYKARFSEAMNRYFSVVPQ